MKLLLIAPKFFDYYIEIIKEMEMLGIDVDFVCDAPNNSNIFKAIARVNRAFARVFSIQYFHDYVIPKIQNKNYNIVLIIGGMTFSLSSQMIEKIVISNPEAKFILYQWDSEKNIPYIKDIHKYMDDIFSFDQADCKKESYYKFLPLFYTSEYEKIGIKKTSYYRFDCAYIGTAHPKKYYYIKLISKMLGKVMPRQYIYHYMPSILKYVYHKLFSIEYSNAVLADFKWKKMTKEEILSVFEKTRCILDVPQSGQNGLTMRTIESIGAKRKIITTNKEIKKYDFFNENNIYIFENSIDISNVFFHSNYIDIDEKIYKKYSLRNWIRVILNIKKDCINT